MAMAMAMTMQMQSLLVNPFSGSTNNGSKSTRMTYPLMGKRVKFSVKCTTKPEERRGDNPNIDTNSSTTSAKINPDILPSGTPKAQPRVNGRAAMVGFVTAMAVELYRGKDLFTQISDGGGHWFLTTSIIISVASLVPLFDGRAPQAREDGVFNSYAELWNGRFAMLGLVALAVTEYVKGGALI
ncbi:Desiccation stress protein DSP-22 chloroplastic [Bienertia sinuspersici]